MSASDDPIDWVSVMTTGTALGWHPAQVYAATLPELLIAVRGWQQARGIKPKPAPMTPNRLAQLHERYG